jgi:hypothetical protein
MGERAQMERHLAAALQQLALVKHEQNRDRLAADLQQLVSATRTGLGPGD